MKDLRTLKATYRQYKDFLSANRAKYQLADKIVTEGIVASHKDMSVDMQDKIYKHAAFFYMQYSLVDALVAQMEDVGVQYTLGN